MGLLSDSDSEDDDCSTSSSEVETAKVDVGQFINKKKVSLDDYEAFKGADDEEDEVARKMKEILQLREALGMDKDVNFLANQAAKEKEKERLAKMTKEERLEEERAKSGDMMAKIRAKQEELARQKAEAGDDGEDSDEEELKIKKKKDKKKKKSKD